MISHVYALTTTYVITGPGTLDEVGGTQRFEITVREEGGKNWLLLGGGPLSMPLDRVPEAIKRGGWTAQLGTKPIYMEPCLHPQDAPMCCGRTCEIPNGGWGGRNYPEIFVPAVELERVLTELVA